MHRSHVEDRERLEMLEWFQDAGIVLTGHLQIHQCLWVSNAERCLVPAQNPLIVSGAADVWELEYSWRPAMRHLSLDQELEDG